MFPFVFEWQWDVGHFIFHGLWYTVLLLMGAGLMVVANKTKKDVAKNDDGEHH